MINPPLKVEQVPVGQTEVKSPYTPFSVSFLLIVPDLFDGAGSPTYLLHIRFVLHSELRHDLQIIT